MTGGRDGVARLWDLRVGGGDGNSGSGEGKGVRNEGEKGGTRKRRSCGVEMGWGNGSECFGVSYSCVMFYFCFELELV